MKWRGSLQFLASVITGAGLMSLELISLLQDADTNPFDGAVALDLWLESKYTHYPSYCTHLSTRYFNDKFCHKLLQASGISNLKSQFLAGTPDGLVNSLSNHVLSSSWLLGVSGPHMFVEFVRHLDDRDVRLLCSRTLASLELPDGESAAAVAASCDDRVMIGVARLPMTDQKLLPWGSEGLQESGPELLKTELRSLLSSLPLSGIDPCTTWFTRSAILTEGSAGNHRRPLFWSFGGDNLSFAQSLSSMPPEQVELYFLKALTRHSMVPSHRFLMVENGILRLIFQEIRHRADRIKIKRELGHILGNLALEEATHSEMVNQGYLPLLRSWMYSEDLALSSHAVRALANLDRDFCDEDTYEEGVYLLHPEGRQSPFAAADIVFVHGLRGGPFMTWRQERVESSKLTTDCWPKTWLAKDIPNARILLVEYDTSLTNWASQCPQEPQTRSLQYRSEELMKKLRRAGVGNRPVIWVTHSMGGLLVKQLLVDAYERQDFRCMCENTRGVVFYSTPHRGSPLAAYSSQARHLLLPSVEVKELSQGSSVLAHLHSSFLELIRHQPVACLSFGEAIPTNISSLFKSLVVSLESSDPGVGQFLPVQADHVHVCKPESFEDPRYLTTLQFIRNQIKR